MNKNAAATHFDTYTSAAVALRERQQIKLLLESKRARASRNVTSAKLIYPTSRETTEAVKSDLHDLLKSFVIKSDA